MKKNHYFFYIIELNNFNLNTTDAKTGKNNNKIKHVNLSYSKQNIVPILEIHLTIQLGS